MLIKCNCLLCFYGLLGERLRWFRNAAQPAAQEIREKGIWLHSDGGRYDGDTFFKRVKKKICCWHHIWRLRSPAAAGMFSVVKAAAVPPHLRTGSLFTSFTGPVKKKNVWNQDNLEDESWKSHSLSLSLSLPLCKLHLCAIASWIPPLRKSAGFFLKISSEWNIIPLIPAI